MTCSFGSDRLIKSFDKIASESSHLTKLLGSSIVVGLLPPSGGLDQAHAESAFEVAKSTLLQFCRCGQQLLHTSHMKSLAHMSLPVAVDVLNTVLQPTAPRGRGPSPVALLSAAQTATQQLTEALCACASDEVAFKEVLIFAAIQC
jgi:hypothetical protein